MKPNTAIETCHHGEILGNFSAKVRAPERMTSCIGFTDEGIQENRKNYTTLYKVPILD